MIEHPKCGRTWLLQMLFRYVESVHGISWDLSAQPAIGLPEVVRTHDGVSITDPAESRFDPDKSPYAQNPVILIVRCPRDVIVSSYFHATLRVKTYRGTLAAFVRDRHAGIKRILLFYEQWTAALRRRPEALNLQIAYRDLHGDTAGRLADVLRFLGVREIDEAAVAETVAYCSFAKAREREIAALRDGSARGNAALGDPDNRESLKARRGQVGSYAEYLSPDDIAYINALMRKSPVPFFRALADEPSPAPLAESP
jgi:hypothetical protein